MLLKLINQLYLQYILHVFIVKTRYLNKNVSSCTWIKMSPPHILWISRHSWFNGYHYWKWTWWHDFKSSMRLFVFHILLIALRKVWIQLFSYFLGIYTMAMHNSSWLYLTERGLTCVNSSQIEIKNLSSMKTGEI